MTDSVGRIPPKEYCAHSVRPLDSGLDVESYGLTESGPERPSNEDRFLCCPALGLFAVADGMGGEVSGAFAADLAMETLVQFVERTHGSEDVSWPFGVDPTLSFDGNRLKTAVGVRFPLARRRASTYRLTRSRTKTRSSDENFTVHVGGGKRRLTLRPLNQ